MADGQYEEVLSVMKIYAGTKVSRGRHCDTETETVTVPLERKATFTARCCRNGKM